MGFPALDTWCGVMLLVDDVSSLRYWVQSEAHEMKPREKPRRLDETSRIATKQTFASAPYTGAAV